jgi:hypothetical protein
MAAPVGWTLKQVLVHGVDATDAVMTFGTRDQSLRNVEVVFTNQVATLGGTVVDGRRQPIAQAVVLAFPVERDRWYFGSRFFGLGRSSGTGSFAIGPMPPGEYYVAAVERIAGSESDGAWQDPEYLATLSREAATVRLGEGQRAAVTLTLGR